MNSYSESVISRTLEWMIPRRKLKGNTEASQDKEFNLTWISLLLYCHTNRCQECYSWLSIRIHESPFNSEINSQVSLSCRLTFGNFVKDYTSTILPWMKRTINLIIIINVSLLHAFIDIKIEDSYSTSNSSLYNLSYWCRCCCIDFLFLQISPSQVSASTLELSVEDFLFMMEVKSREVYSVLVSSSKTRSRKASRKDLQSTAGVLCLAIKSVTTAIVAVFMILILLLTLVLPHQGIDNRMQTDTREMRRMTSMTRVTTIFASAEVLQNRASISQVRLALKTVRAIKAFKRKLPKVKPAAVVPLVFLLKKRQPKVLIIKKWGKIEEKEAECFKWQWNRKCHCICSLKGSFEGFPEAWQWMSLSNRWERNVHWSWWFEMTFYDLLPPALVYTLKAKFDRVELLSRSLHFLSTCINIIIIFCSPSLMYRQTEPAFTDTRRSRNCFLYTPNPSCLSWNPWWLNRK